MNKYVVALVLQLSALLILILSCGREGEKDPAPAAPGKDGQSCVVSDTGTITCGATSYTLPTAQNGKDGVAGVSGPSGDGCVVSSTGLVTCGGSTYQIPEPVKGDQGEVGPAGPQGFPGTDASTISAVIPCPTLAGPYPEVLLCISDVLYAVMVGNGNQIRYTKVIPGTYSTTDSRQCVFTVVSGCTIQ